MENMLEVCGISKQYKGFRLENISFALPSGYIMGLVGPNGAGKTTIIKSIINAVNLDSGSVNIFGLNVHENEIRIKDKLGYISDTVYFLDEWTAKDVNLIMSKIHSSWRNTDFEKYMREFDLPTKKQIKDYSSGMKTKLMLASVFSRDTELLILDEPTSGLDPVMRDEFLTLIKEYIRDGRRSVLYSTHITTDLEKTADYITFINGGNLVFTDEIDILREKYYLVKDSLDALDGIIGSCIGIRRYDYGFEALVSRENLIKMPEACVRQSANIDDIVVFHSMKGERSQ